MDQAKDILPDLYRQGSDRELEEWELIRAYWPEAVGRILASHANPVRLKGETLVIEVDNETWRSQIEAIQGRIVQSLRRELKRSVVKKLELRPVLPARRLPGRAAAAFPWNPTATCKSASGK